MIVHEGHVLVLHPDLTLEFDGYHYNMEHTQRLGSQFKSFQMSLLGPSLLFISNRYGFWVRWDRHSNVAIGVCVKMIEQIDGLCGYFNGDDKDDKRKPDGRLAKSTSEFGDSWARDTTICEAEMCPISVQDKAWDMCNQVK